MASAPLDSKVPKAVLLARQKLQAQHLDITAENLGKALTSSDLSTLASAMRYNLNKGDDEKLKSDYKNIDSDDERRKWMAAYCVDPNVSRCFAFQKTTREITSGTKVRKIWLTLEQMAGPLVFNSMVHAEIVAKKAPERPSQYAALAEEGIMEYHVEVTEEVFMRLTKDEVGVRAESEMSADDYSKVKRTMDGTSAPPKPKRQKLEKVPLEDMTPNSKTKLLEAQKRSAATKDFQQYHKSAKSLGDKLRREVEEQTKVAESLPEHGLPKQMAEYYLSGFNPIMAMAAAVIDTCAEYMMVDLTMATSTEIQTMARTLKEKQSELESEKTEFDAKKKQLKGIVPKPAAASGPQPLAG